jgi:hypothetical protein
MALNIVPKRVYKTGRQTRKWNKVVMWLRSGKDLRKIKKAMRGTLDLSMKADIPRCMYQRRAYIRRRVIMALETPGRLSPSVDTG